MPENPENHRKHDPHEIEGVTGRSSMAAAFPWIRVSFCVGLWLGDSSPRPIAREDMAKAQQP